MATDPTSLPDRIKDDMQTSSGQIWGTGPNPPSVGKPLPPDDPWVINMSKMFGIPIPEAQLFAARFRDNMFQWLNNEIKRDTQKQHEAAERFKRSIEGDD